MGGGDTQAVGPRFAVLARVSVSLRRLAFPPCGLHPKQYEKWEGGDSLASVAGNPWDRVPGSVSEGPVASQHPAVTFT